ncbi:MAG: S41 family peptidase, partial [Planctomycetota bacterium]
MSLSPTDRRAPPVFRYALCVSVAVTPVVAAAQPNPQSNLVALARLYRLVRFYHPSELAAKMNWDDRLLAGLSAVEMADDEQALVEALRRFVADLHEPPVKIRRTRAQPTSRPPPPRSGPEVAMENNVLYVALSPGDCCPTAIQKIEELADSGAISRWILDLRDTARRSFGSIYSEVKVTLSWTVAGEAWAPPRLGRIHYGLGAHHVQSRYGSSFKMYPASSAEGPSMLADLPLIVLIDETTHPGAGGWLLGLQRSQRGVVVGRPVSAQAEASYILELTPTVEAAVPLTRFAPLHPDPRSGTLVEPDFVMDLPKGISPAELVAELSQLDVAGHGRRAKEATHPPRPAIPEKLFNSDRPPPSQPARAEPKRPIQYHPRTLRLAEVIVTYAVLRDFYPGWGTVGADPERLLCDALSIAAAGDGTYPTGVERFIAGTGDGQAEVIPRSRNEYRVPAVRLASVQGQLVVAAVAAGIRDLAIGDIVRGIDGADAPRHLASIAQEIPGSSQWRRQRCAMLALAGPAESAVQVVLQPPGATDHRTVNLRRNAPVLRPVQSQLPQTRTLANGIVYLDLTRLAADKMSTVLPVLAESKGIILDLRGRVSRRTRRILRHLIDGEVTCTTSRIPVRIGPDDFENELRDVTWRMEPADPRLTVPVVLLVDGSTIAEAEVVAYLAKQYNLAKLCGGITAGAFGETNGILLPSGTQLVWSATRTGGPDGVDHSCTGITPDVPAVPTLAGIRAGRDEVLQSAVRYVNEVRSEK